MQRNEICFEFSFQSVYVHSIGCEVQIDSVQVIAKADCQSIQIPSPPADTIFSNIVRFSEFSDPTDASNPEAPVLSQS